MYLQTDPIEQDATQCQFFKRSLTAFPFPGSVAIPGLEHPVLFTSS